MGSIPPPSELNSRHFQAVQSVCVIGAGPSGIAAAKYLLSESLSRIVIYEQRTQVGGLWNFTPLPQDIHIPVPQTRAQYEHPGGDDDDNQDALITPVYERLETNIPRDLMGFSDCAWQDDLQLFPKHEDVLGYLQGYAKDVRPLVQLGRRVESVRRLEGETEKWEVVTTAAQQAGGGDGGDGGGEEEKEEEEKKKKKKKKKKHKSEIFDAVICASGHYDVPYIPAVRGIEAWNAKYPQVITHSKFYRVPERFAGKKVIVVGNAASGVDIGAQVDTVCRKPLIMSSRSESFLKVPGAAEQQTPKYLEKPEIVEYLLEGADRSVKFADGSVEEHVDAVLYCTGYFYSYPFLESLDPPVVTTGERVENLYQHMFYRPHPTLAFVGLSQKVIPFPMAQAQAAVIARVFSGRLKLPDPDVMKSWEEATVRENGAGRGFHVFAFPKDAEHWNFLHDWAASAEREADGVGKTPPFCSEKLYWIRERFPSIKKAFADVGEGRHQVRTLEEIGFAFAKWKEEQRQREQIL